MQVQAVAADAAQTSLPTQGLVDSQDFMTLLVAQLKAQDPLEPMDPSQFLTQLAQLQTVSELGAISSLLGEARASDLLGAGLSLIGRTVHWRDAESGDLLSAPVERIEMEQGQCRIIAGGRELTMADLVAIT